MVIWPYLCLIYFEILGHILFYYYSIIKKTGARGLRSILENILLDTMYKLPILEGLEEVVVNSEVVKNNREPLQIFTDKKNKVDTTA